MIKLRKTSGGRTYTGDTIADKETLREFGCPMFFPIAEYDDVLSKVGYCGFGLETEIEEGENATT